MEFHAQYTIYLQHFSLGSASILLLTAATYIFLKKGSTAKVIYVSSVISVLSMFAIGINTTLEMRLSCPKVIQDPMLLISDLIVVGRNLREQSFHLNIAHIPPVHK